MLLVVGGILLQHCADVLTECPAYLFGARVVRVPHRLMSGCNLDLVGSDVLRLPAGKWGVNQLSAGNQASPRVCRSNASAQAGSSAHT